MPFLETRNITKSFGALTAVNGVSLAVEAGSLHSVIGPNGAGKTTLFNLLTGTFPPTSGKIIFDQKDITGTPANRVAHLGLARSYQRTTVFPAFSLFDNVWSPLLRLRHPGRVCFGKTQANFRKLTDELVKRSPTLV